jgi:hypothetical protein|tara:strand:+ start:354 stop:827 length:474 start_codon:yes stop_codon:yes gene_type:complete
MTKKITSIVQNNDGDTNPKTGLFEQPVWVLELEDGEKRILGKEKMEEYLSKGYERTVHSFKRWVMTSVSGTEISAYCVVFTDKSHDLIPTTKLREQLYNGHKRKDLEKYEQLEQELKEKSQLNPALFHPPKTITTEDEKKELEEFREKVLNDKDRII